MRTAALVMLLLAALVAPAAADKVAVPTTAAPAIPADLAVFGPGGLQVGATVLYTQQVDGAAYDAKQDLIWFVSKRQLFVVDLRDAKPAPIAIAKNLPEGLASFGVGGLSTADWQTDYAGVYPQFSIDKKVKASAEVGAYADVDPEADASHKKAIKKIKIVGAKWVTAQKDRKPHDVPADRGEAPKVTLPAGVGECSEEDLCGQATWLGDTAYQAVLIKHDCGDACHTECVLYDPKAKKFAPGLADGTWGAVKSDMDGMSCIGLAVEPGGGHYFSNEGNKVCTLGAGKMTCVDLEPLVPFAWIAPPGK